MNRNRQEYSNVRRASKHIRFSAWGSKLEYFGWGLLKLALLMGLLAALWWGIWYTYRQLMQDEGLRLEAIEIRPALRYGDATVLEGLVLEHLYQKQSLNMIDIDVAQLATAVQKVSWVHSVKVRKQSLRRLVLEVEERVPVFRWGQDEFIDAAGVRFKVPMTEELGQLFEVHGPDGRERMVLQYAEVIKPWLDEQNIGVKALWMDGNRRWYLELKENVKIALGEDKLNERLKRLSFVYHRRLKTDWPLLDELNFAHPTGVVMTLKKGLVVMKDEANAETTAPKNSPVKANPR